MITVSSEKIIIAQEADWPGVQNILSELPVQAESFELVIRKKSKNDFTVHFTTEKKVKPINFVALHDLFW